MWDITITLQGEQLISRAIAGEKLQFTHVQMGKAYNTGAPHLATGVQDLVAEALINSVEQAGNNIAVTCQFSNLKGLSFFHRELALFARIENEADSVIAYGYNGNPEYIDGSLPNVVSELQFTINIPVASEAVVDVEVSPTLALSRTEWQAYGHGRYKNIFEALCYAKDKEICTVLGSMKCGIYIPKDARFVQQLGRYLLFDAPRMEYTSGEYTSGWEPVEGVSRCLAVYDALDIREGLDDYVESKFNWGLLNDVPDVDNSSWQNQQESIRHKGLVMYQCNVCVLVGAKLYSIPGYEVLDLETAHAYEFGPSDEGYDFRVYALEDGRAIISVHHYSVASGYDLYGNVFYLFDDGVISKLWTMQYIHNAPQATAAHSFKLLRARGEYTGKVFGYVQDYLDFGNEGWHILSLEADERARYHGTIDAIHQAMPCTILGKGLHNEEDVSSADVYASPDAYDSAYKYYIGAMLAHDGIMDFLNSLPHISRYKGLSIEDVDTGFTVGNAVCLIDDGVLISYTEGLLDKAYMEGGYMMPYEVK